MIHTVPLIPQKSAFKDAQKYIVWLRLFKASAIIISVIGTIISFAPFYSRNIEVAFIVLSLIFTVAVFTFQQRFHTTYRHAEEIRRDGLIDSAYNTRMADMRSEGYYDTDGIENGSRKLLANIHDNSFVSSRIIDSMFKRNERSNLFAFFALVIAALISSLTSQTFIAVLQAFLSMSFLGRYFRLRDLKETLDIIQNKCKGIWENLSSNKSATIDITQQAHIIREVLRYETALAYACIVFDENIYNKLNDETTKAWNTMRKRYEI